MNIHYINLILAIVCLISSILIFKFRNVKQYVTSPSWQLALTANIILCLLNSLSFIIWKIFIVYK